MPDPVAAGIMADFGPEAAVTREVGASEGQGGAQRSANRTMPKLRRKVDAKTTDVDDGKKSRPGV